MSPPVIQKRKAPGRRDWLTIVETVAETHHSPASFMIPAGSRVRLGTGPGAVVLETSQNVVEGQPVVA